MVVRDNDVGRPERPSWVANSSEQNETFDPLSRKAYVSMIRLLPGAFTLTEIIAKLAEDNRSSILPLT